MKAVLIYYILSTLVYFLVGTGSLFWALFNMLSILLSFTYFLIKMHSGYVVLDNGCKEWVFFAIILTVARCLYSTACPLAPTEWIYSGNKIFATIFIIWILIKILQERYRKRSGINYR